MADSSRSSATSGRGCGPASAPWHHAGRPVRGHRRLGRARCPGWNRAATADLELLLPLAEAHGCRWTTWWARRHRRPARPPAPAEPRRPDHRAADPPGRAACRPSKMVIPAHREAQRSIQKLSGKHSNPTSRCTRVTSWMYVLNGKMRLLLGQQDLVLPPGEAAEFDTRLPALVRQRRRRAGGVPVPVRAAGDAPTCGSGPRPPKPDQLADARRQLAGTASTAS